MKRLERRNRRLPSRICVTAIQVRLFLERLMFPTNLEQRNSTNILAMFATLALRTLLTTTTFVISLHRLLKTQAKLRMVNTTG